MKYVIIGNSTAAAGCVEGIRSVDKNGEITLFSKEKYHTYSRPLISYLLCGKTTLEKMKYRPDGFYDENKVDAHLNEAVVSVDANSKTVKTEKGEYAFDKLLVATGSDPFVPKTENSEKASYFTFGSLDDALKLEAAVTPESRVLIVGAGLIGLKCAEGLYGRVAKITVADLADRVLSSILDEKGSEIVKKHLIEKGIELKLGACVKDYENDIAILSDGSKVPFDILVMAVGVRPSTALAAACGCKVNRGIVTDENGMTSIEGVYAAGDCCESYDITADASRVLALLPNAYFQGHRCGVVMAGGEEVFNNAVPMNSMGILGLHMVTAGSYSGDAHIIEDENGYKKLVTRDNKLVGYIIIGNIDRAGIYTGLIRNRVPLDTIDFELVSEKPQLMAYTRGERAKLLGGAK